MAISWPSKDPDEIFDYRWTVELDAGDVLKPGATLTKVAGSAAIVSGSIQSDETGIRVEVEGGIDGDTTVFEGRGETVGGRNIEETILLPIVSSAAAKEMAIAFPQFAGVGRGQIAYWMKRADRIVDDSWPEDDRDHARMLLTAHLLTQQGLGTGAEAQAFAAGASGFKTLRSGALTLERFEGGGGGDLDGTSYGRQFKLLARAVKGGPRVTGTGTVPGCAPFGYGCGRLPGW